MMNDLQQVRQLLRSQNFIRDSIMVIQFNKKTGSRGIEWTDRTHNRTGGCHHGCVWTMPDGTRVECYAKVLAENGVAKSAYPNGFEHHYWRQKNAGAMQRLKTPSLIFIDSMSDLFAQEVPVEHVGIVLEEVKQAPQHIGQVLTKNAPRILKFQDQLPVNLWIGVSSPPDEMRGIRLSRAVQEKMLRVQLRVLEKIQADRPDLITWMSIEPLSWDISKVLSESCPLKWAVIGAATNGRKAYQPADIHVSSVLDVLDRNEVPVFFKGNLEWPEWREDYPLLNHPALLRRQQMAKEHGWTLNRVLLTRRTVGG